MAHRYVAIDPLALLLSPSVYVRLTLPDPPPPDVLTKEIALLVRGMDETERTLPPPGSGRGAAPLARAPRYRRPGRAGEVEQAVDVLDRNGFSTGLGGGRNHRPKSARRRRLGAAWPVTRTVGLGGSRLRRGGACPLPRPERAELNSPAPAPGRGVRVFS